jgi:type III secretory pathway component EscV
MSDPDAAWLADSAHLVAFVRTGLKRQLSFQHTRGQTTLPVLLIDTEIEHSLAQGPISANQRGEIINAIRSELKELIGRTPPTLLTSIEARAALRNLTCAEFPRLPVLAYQELSADTNIQPLARISI